MTSTARPDGGSENPRQNVTFASDGSSAHGYLATPASGRGPGVVVVQEWWGLDDHMAEVVDRLASEGFVALAPDLFGGRVAHDSDEAGRLMQQLPVEQAARDLGGAVDFLLQHEAVTSSTVGAVGFCMGGGFVLLLAAQQGEKVSAAVPFYGAGPGPGGADPPGGRRPRRVLLLRGRPRVPQRQGQAGHLRPRGRGAGLEPHRRLSAVERALTPGTDPRHGAPGRVPAGEERRDCRWSRLPWDADRCPRTLRRTSCRSRRRCPRRCSRPPSMVAPCLRRSSRRTEPCAGST